MLPWFPAWCIEFEEAVTDPSVMVSKINEWRPSDRWFILAEEAAGSESHLWTVWYSTRKKEVTNSMVARDVSAEFMRILSGTHQISLAIERSGLSSGDKRAWIVHLPDIDVGGSLGELSIPRSTYNDADKEATRLQEHLEAKLLATRPIATISGLERIGAITKGQEVENSEIESLFILHSAMADM